MVTLIAVVRLMAGGCVVNRCCEVDGSREVDGCFEVDG